ncbi:MAG: sigma-54-dependent Fis family transcriptional regulator [Ignavibacteriaceae bacterium]|nr:sigma-54-dependent Fis family transcriptional regulator [Ignavibacteriaceae bacterium]
MKLLIIEDEKITRISLSNTLAAEGFEVFSAGDGEEGLAIFSREMPDIVITDLRLPKISGMEILERVITLKADCRVILITAYATVETAVRALKTGAYDYLTKPFSPEELLSILRKIKQFNIVLEENKELKKRINLLENRTIIGNSPAMKKLSELISQIAQNDSTVLIEGESGTGKELVARALHQHGPRRNEPFIVVSCSSIPDTLLESELFGHEKGAFTGAVNRHTGYFERANKGTLFIDDIDDIPLLMQVKLLRVIQERELTRVGGSDNVKIDVRIIAATKVNLKKKVELREFRDDLYYRLNIIPVRIPPLRERKDDLPILIKHFFGKYGSEKKFELLNEEILKRMIEYNWPGNVRELENIVQRIIALSFLGTPDFTLIEFPGQSVRYSPAPDSEVNYPPFEEYILQKEKEIIDWALKKSEDNISRAAKLLGIPRTTLTSKLNKFLC